MSKKMLLLAGAALSLFAIELFALWFSLNALSAARVLKNTEELWSMAQKNAIKQLKKYSQTHNEKNYQQYEEFLKTPFGVHNAFIELNKKEPNLQIVHSGFINVSDNPKTANEMIKLFQTFHNNSSINNATNNLIEANSMLSSLILVGRKLHAGLSAENVSVKYSNAIISTIDPINKNLVLLDNEFFSTSERGIRKLENLTLFILFLIVLTIELVGLYFVNALNIGITKGINEVIRVADKVAKTDFSERAAVYSNDKIGQLAITFNQLTDDLQKNTNQKNQIETELELTNKKLILSNNELEQFAYVASHDLQEPLRMVTSYVQLLESRYESKFDAEGKEFIAFAVDGTSRMKNLIHSLLDYSRINKTRPFEHIDLNLLSEKILLGLELQIIDNSACIKIDTLPDIYGDPVLITQLFHNLISNAIKFRRTDNPVIIISGKKTNNEYLFSIKDNGIGIPLEYSEKIFVIFKRLHPKEKYPGTGMGLAICKKIVEHHGGNIWMESDVDIGSVFYFTIKTFNHAE